ncbi:dienelactone hydrolase family protein [Rhizorhabdus sp.]|uniref:dienelactone hydrolase family protein n=1 Tax=Rhizorhabdus sp. TaxID=1968843 RepID=UPI0012208E79|nr:dienelactone hydrolase family protein [Rhizorhabdus sp.]MBD3760625.1 dienelactone hydrolase family protein [Rhizorhabdus sp.]TAK06958.1 MAG: carboxymethylenebutenolidase [Rhizorhabdus sp.]
MPIAARTIRYEHGGVEFQAYAAWDDTGHHARPIVMVAGTFMGRTEFEAGKARALAALGYVGVAIDVYGLGHWPADQDEARAQMDLLDADRALLLARLNAALAAVRTLGGPADGGRVAAIGFCFGGKCVLDLARSGADVAGVVSFHGVYDPPPFPRRKIATKVLVLHGWDDPVAPPESVLALSKELSEAGADWQLHSYGLTVHAFTNPARGAMYSADADRRSWQAMTNFLEEIFP